MQRRYLRGQEFEVDTSESEDPAMKKLGRQPELTPAESSDNRRTTIFAAHCKWLAEQLRSEGHASRARFEREFFDTEGTTRDDRSKNVSEAWSRASRAVQAALVGYEVNVSLDSKAHSLVLNTRRPRRFENRAFQPWQYSKMKSRIGWLVAHYLWFHQKRHVLLGSGSTVFHVGLQMQAMSNEIERQLQVKKAEKQHLDHDIKSQYQQLFWTVNIALAACWCEGHQSPVDRLQIPKGELRTTTYRYASMENPDWNCPIAVVGADGCYLHHDGTATLYANESSVAHNTNHFTKNALDTVVCCIVSDKLRYDPNTGQNAGPTIHGPNRTHKDKGPVKWFLVTDERPDADNPMVKSLSGFGWHIVSGLKDWNVGGGEDNSVSEVFPYCDDGGPAPEAEFGLFETSDGFDIASRVIDIREDGDGTDLS